MEALKQLNFYRPQRLLSEQCETIEAHLRAHPPHTINEAISVIEALTGLKLGDVAKRIPGLTDGVAEERELGQ